MWLQHESVLTPFFFIPDPINVTNYVLKKTNIALIGSLEPLEKNDSDHKTKQKSSTAADWLNQDLHKPQLHRLLWPIRDQPKRKCDWTNLVHAVQNYDKQRKNYGLNHILVNYTYLWNKVWIIKWKDKNWSTSWHDKYAAGQVKEKDLGIKVARLHKIFEWFFVPFGG